MKRFNKAFTQQEPISAEAISAATEVLNTGRLHRYNTLPNELSEVDKLEMEFAAYHGYALLFGLFVRWLCLTHCTASSGR